MYLLFALSHLIWTWLTIHMYKLAVYLLNENHFSLPVWLVEGCVRECVWHWCCGMCCRIGTLFVCLWGHAGDTCGCVLIWPGVSLSVWLDMNICHSKYRSLFIDIIHIICMQNRSAQAQPADKIFYPQQQVAQFRGKTLDLATLSGIFLKYLHKKPIDF